MKWKLTFKFVWRWLLFLVLVATFAVSLGYRDRINHHRFDPPPELELGKPVPTEYINCYFDAMPYYLQCQYRMYYVYYNQDRIIYRVGESPYVNDIDITAGELVNEWGTPIAYSNRYYFYILIWPDKMAYADPDDQGVSPGSKIWTIVWQLAGSEEKTKLWRGWIHSK